MLEVIVSEVVLTTWLLHKCLTVLTWMSFCSLYRDFLEKLCHVCLFLMSMAPLGFKKIASLSYQNKFGSEHVIVCSKYCLNKWYCQKINVTSICTRCAMGSLCLCILNCSFLSTVNVDFPYLFCLVVLQSYVESVITFFMQFCDHVSLHISRF